MLACVLDSGIASVGYDSRAPGVRAEPRRFEIPLLVLIAELVSVAAVLLSSCHTLVSARAQTPVSTTTPQTADDPSSASSPWSSEESSSADTSPSESSYTLDQDSNVETRSEAQTGISSTQEGAGYSPEGEAFSAGPPLSSWSSGAGGSSASLLGWSPSGQTTRFASDQAQSQRISGSTWLDVDFGSDSEALEVIS